MNVCIPVDEDKGLQSPVCPHLGSAPMFMMVDSGTGACRAIPNGRRHDEHGACTPLAAVAAERIDVMVVGGIGTGAMNQLAAAGIRVCLAEGSSVAEVMNAVHAGTLRTMPPEQVQCRH